MKLIKNLIIFYIMSLLLLGCGFKTLDKSKISSYEIVNIDSFGDKRINFLIKNDLKNKFKNVGSNQKIKINLTTNKKKTIKDKNIKNQIVKYQISIDSTVQINFINLNKTQTIDVTSKGSYNVATSHSTTINNQNNLENNLANKISEEIINKLILFINDL